MLIGLDGNEANVQNRVGSGVYAHNMLNEFSSTKTHNFLVYLKENPLADLPKESANFKYHVFGPKKLWTRFALPIKLFIGQKPDVFASLGHYGPYISNVPYAVTIFDLSYLHFPEMFSKNDLYQLVNWSKRSILKSKHIFAISQSTKDDIVKNYDVSSSKITVTYMGYDSKSFRPQTKSKIEKIKRKYKIPGDYIIFVGTLQPRKNVEKLLESFSIIHNPYPLIHLVVVGRKGWMYETIFAKVKELNLESNVVFTDFVPQSDLPSLISGAKAYVLPSLWEGFGIPVVEAQACGVPAIVSNVSSLPEIVGDSAILIKPTDPASIAEAIKSVLRDEKHRERLTESGYKNVKRFSWQKCAKDTLKVLERI